MTKIDRTTRPELPSDLRSEDQKDITHVWCCCGAGDHALTLMNWNMEPPMWDWGYQPGHHLNLLGRIKLAWSALRGKGLYSVGIMMDEDQMRNLAETIQGQLGHKKKDDA